MEKGEGNGMGRKEWEEEWEMGQENGKLRPKGKKVIERRMGDGGEGEGKKGMEGRLGESRRRWKGGSCWETKKRIEGTVGDGGSKGRESHRKKNWKCGGGIQ